jgi:hypothetical protein
MDFSKILQHLASASLAENFYEQFINRLTTNLLAVINYETLSKALDLTETQLRESISKGYTEIKDKFPLHSDEKDLMDLHNSMLKIARENILKMYIEK